MYNWQRPDWPAFYFDQSQIDPVLHRYQEQVTALQESITALPAAEARAFTLDRIVEEAHATSSIEGEDINRKQLMSALLNTQSFGRQRHAIRDVRATCIVKQIEANRETWADPITETTLKYWHGLLLGYENRLNAVGDYRRGSTPMRIVSGPDYRQEIHFEAPPADRVPREMPPFIAYCNASKPQTAAGIARAGVAHIWFESIHPFEDGNGRLGRAIVEKMLSQSLGVFVPFSVSHSIERRKKEYYAALKASSHGPDITPWMTYFSEVLLASLEHANRLIDFTLKKHRYLAEVGSRLSAHEQKAIDKMLDAGPKGFQGGMTTKKYMRINRVSQPTAARALRHLTQIGALVQRGQGRATHYLLPFGEDAE